MSSADVGNDGSLPGPLRDFNGRELIPAKSLRDHHRPRIFEIQWRAPADIQDGYVRAGVFRMGRARFAILQINCEELALPKYYYT
jgi:hypothetical protein